MGFLGRVTSGNHLIFLARKAAHLEGRDQPSGFAIKQMKLNGFVPLFVVLERVETRDEALGRDLLDRVDEVMRCSAQRAGRRRLCGARARASEAHQRVRQIVVGQGDGVWRGRCGSCGVHRKCGG